MAEPSEMFDEVEGEEVEAQEPETTDPLPEGEPEAEGEGAAQETPEGEGDGAPESADEKEEEGEKEEEEDPVLSLKSENRELRRTLREQHALLKTLKAGQDKHEQSLKDNQLLKEEEEGEAAPVDQGKRQEDLSTMLELMRLNPGFADVDEVVTQDNFDDTIDLLAKAYVAQNGGSLNDVAAELAAHVWSQPNPYRLMYGKIKEMHPAFSKVAKPTTKRDPVKPDPKAPVTIHDIPGGENPVPGWTKEKIDSMDEEDLDSVPHDIYQKYLRNELK